MTSAQRPANLTYGTVHGTLPIPPISTARYVRKPLLVYK